MRYKAVFVDTWGWMALGHRRERRHVKVKQLFRELRRQKVPLYTSDYVLDELITLLFQRETFQEATRFVGGILAAAARGQVHLDRITSVRFEAAWKLRQQFQDKPRISFTDLTSMALMEEHSVHQVLTEDKHFVQVGLGFVCIP